MNNFTIEHSNADHILNLTQHLINLRSYHTIPPTNPNDNSSPPCHRLYPS